ncbi:FAD-dependent oxidoreductase [Streptomyces sp. NPDC056296]|uniref:FAD-dependent oxidoreductase n=1 Tax=Streptomyces sp. NPDC056296 TaxID=3345775 RepID=UPI0035DE714C
MESDVAVIGGGLGAVAAALAAARAGRRVLLAAHADRLGGQATTQLVPALDEHPHVEQAGISASYRALRELTRAAYGGLPNPGDGWVSRLCAEPVAFERALETLLAPHVDASRLTVLRSRTPIRAVRATDGTDRIAGVVLAGPRGDELTVRAEAFCDASEAGDLLPLAGADWVCGSEGTDAHGESLALPGGPHPDAVQSCTVGFVVEHRAGEDHTGPEPVGYAALRDAQPFTLDIAGWDDRTHRYRVFTDGPDGHPPFWTYRRLRSAALLGAPEAALINWSGNDYAASSSLDDPAAAYTLAKHLSAAFLHWLRTECPRDDGSGRGYPGLRLRPDIAGTPDGFAAEPYLREARRLRTARVVREQDLTPVTGSARAVAMPDACGVASYHMDLHARVGHPGSAYAPTAPFQVPLSALVAESPGNLLAAAKNLGATQVAAAAYRVHHGEWAVGEAAGALAAHAVATHRSLSAVVADPRTRLALQANLVADGVPLAWLLDVPTDAEGGVPAHLLVAAGGLTGRRRADLAVRPHEPATEADRAALHAAAERLTGRPLTGVPVADGDSWADQVRAVGTAIGLAPERPAPAAGPA